MFLFKKKKIVVDCFTYREWAHQYAPIQHSSEFYPDWWKRLPKSIEDDESLKPYRTMKNCIGFIRQYQKGFIIPMWSDLKVELGPEIDPYYKWCYSDNMSSLEIHPQEQRGSFLPEPKYQNLKLSVPWLVRCNTPINWQEIFPIYSFDEMDNYTTLPGILDLYYQHSVNINMMFKRTNEKQSFLFKHGQPMLQFVPLSDEKIDLKCHYIDESEYIRLSERGAAISFIGAYKTIRKNYRCPFHSKVDK